MRMLDLFCGAGLGAWGYWSSGRFSEIVGIDINPQPAYSFDFIQADALSLSYEFLHQFDFIHASPPCQVYSKQTEAKYLLDRLIPGTRLMCEAAGVPYVIENVEGSSRQLKPNLVMDGHSFDLPSERRRYFYVSTLEAAVRLMKRGRSISINGREFVSRADVIAALGLDTIISSWRLAHISVKDMEQGISPHMTKRIAEMIFPKKFMLFE